MRQVKRLKYITAIMLALAVCFTVMLVSGIGGKAYAASSEYTNVLDDLNNDPSFDAASYSESSAPYIKVIQIAESKSGKVFLYTYQPCLPLRQLKATNINMSLTDSAVGTRLYDLEYINSEGVFGKYLIKDLTVSSDPVRFYNITSISRAWVTDIDGETGTNNTGNKKAYPVRNIYMVSDTDDGGLLYYRKPTQVVQILNPYSDYIIYAKNVNEPLPGLKVKWGNSDMVDNHYVAFSTDWDIDKLISADVHYYWREATHTANKFLWFGFGENLELGKTEHEETVTVTAGTKHEVQPIFGGIQKSYKYEWDEIQTVDEFIEGEQYLSDETKKNLEGKQWVLRFATTERTQEQKGILGYTNGKQSFTKVERVSILRLEFETEGVVYNLGAVSDEVTGDDHAGNIQEKQDSGVFGYIWNCIKKLFTGTASSWEKFVAIVTMIVALVVFGCAVAFVKWLYRKVFK